MSEARRLFRENKGEKEAAEVARLVNEAESRLELAIHYGTAYTERLSSYTMTERVPIATGPRRINIAGHTKWLE